MRKKISVIMALVLCVGLVAGICGCGKKTEKTPSGQEAKTDEEKENTGKADEEKENDTEKDPEKENEKETKTFRVMVGDGLEKELFDAIIREGFDKEAGFTLEMVAVEEPQKALEEGKADLYVGAMSDEFEFQHAGMDAVIVGQACMEAVILAAPDSKISSLYDCKDEVLLKQKYDDNYAKDYLLAQGNLSADFIKVKQTENVNELKEKLSNGEGKLIMVREPLASEFIKEGYVELARTMDSRLHYGAMITKAGRMEEKNKLFAGFKKACEKAAVTLSQTSDNMWAAEYPYLVLPSEEELADVYAWAVQNIGVPDDGFSTGNYVKELPAGE